MPIAPSTGTAAVFCALLVSSALALVPSDQPEPPSTGSSATGPAAGTAGPSGYDPPIQPASDEAERALASFRIPEGMTGTLLAAEPLLANPVAFWMDEHGRYWVCETFRQENAVIDNRGRGDAWLLDDLAAQTVEDRLAYYRKHLGDERFETFTEHHDRIRLLTDTTGDGRLDHSTVFADGFNAPEDGTGAGVLTLADDVYYTNIPHLWRLRDTTGDGIADEREALASGFGVRTAFRGHDLHGLIMGPDGRLYFSIGDRGFNVVNKEGQRLAMPDTGAVFRCEPDGSNLEIFAYGLRNPQELAFDDYGNLFTGDNNSDSGDRARWVYVAEGSDSGWRMYYQYLDDRGPWNREMMWLPHETPALEREIATGIPTGIAAKHVQPAYLLPPITNIADGPSGLTFYPGVGLSEKYTGHFFLCDFRGTPGNSGVRSFSVKPKGAGFELVNAHEFIWGILCTDADFAPDGRFVIADWVNGWTGEGKGRLYAFHDPEQTAAGEESARLLAEDFAPRTSEQLVELFRHRDRRVRQKAHFELAKRPRATWPEQVDALAQQGDTFSVLHLVWAAGIAARREGLQHEELFSLAAQHNDAQVRAAALRAATDALRPLGPQVGPNVSPNVGPKIGSPDQHKLALASEKQVLLALSRMILDGLDDQAPAVQREAALGLARVARVAGDLLPWRPKLFDLLAEKTDDDPVLRHALQVALAEAGKPDDLAAAKVHESASVRIGAVVALRRQGSPHVADFLNDSDPAVVSEAARAINDVPIDDAAPQLAALASTSRLNDPTLRRILNANFRLGERQHAESVARIAADREASVAVRIEAISMLRLWADPPPTDRVTGMSRPLPSRDASFVPEVAQPIIAALLDERDGRLRAAAIELATTYKLKDALPALREIALDRRRRDRERTSALAALAALATDDLNAILERAVVDESASVRSAARTLWATHDPHAAIPVLDRTIAEGEIVEKQSAIAALAAIDTDAADAVLARWFDKFLSNQVPSEIHLDLVEAARRREALHGRLQAYESALSPSDKLAPWRIALAGGDAARGRDIFLNWASVSCLRCHKTEDNRGGDVGPNLARIGSEKDREYLLESIVDPNAKIAEGFETLVVVTAEGLVHSGVKRAEDNDALTLITPEAHLVVIPQDEIEDRAAGQSAMPEDLVKHLTTRDMRDLIEYLAQQRGQGRWRE